MTGKDVTKKALCIRSFRGQYVRLMVQPSGAARPEDRADYAIGRDGVSDLHSGAWTHDAGMVASRTGLVSAI